jgi:hypothetical protein
MHRATGETLTLTPEQTQRAVNLLKRTDDGEVGSPTDIVDSWNDPKTTINRDLKEGTYPRYEDFVSPDAIAGSVGLSNRLEENRIKRVLVNMLEDNFEVQNSAPPVLQKRKGRFYVTSDGHHRCMVARTIGLNELYAEFSEVPPEILE